MPRAYRLVPAGARPPPSAPPRRPHLLASLEGFGFCPEGESGAFVQNGRIEIGGALPCNTSGGTFSESYIPRDQVGLSEQRRLVEREDPAIAKQPPACDHHPNHVARLALVDEARDDATRASRTS